MTSLIFLLNFTQPQRSFHFKVYFIENTDVYLSNDVFFRSLFLLPKLLLNILSISQWYLRFMDTISLQHCIVWPSMMHLISNYNKYEHFSYLCRLGLSFTIYFDDFVTIHDITDICDFWDLTILVNSVISRLWICPFFRFRQFVSILSFNCQCCQLCRSCP